LPGKAHARGRDHRRKGEPNGSVNSLRTKRKNEKTNAMRQKIPARGLWLTPSGGPRKGKLSEEANSRLPILGFRAMEAKKAGGGGREVGQRARGSFKGGSWPRKKLWVRKGEKKTAAELEKNWPTRIRCNCNRGFRGRREGGRRGRKGSGKRFWPSRLHIAASV